MSNLWKFVGFLICINAAWSETKLKCRNKKILRNLALRKPTNQSSTLTDHRLHTTFVPGLAVDGIRQANWVPPYCTHTHLEYTPFWYVDLGGQHDIDRVEIVNRKDLAVRQRDISVVVAQKQGEFDQTCDHFKGPATHVPVVKMKCPEGTQGRYVKVQMATSPKNYLVLCEVEVYGY